MANSLFELLFDFKVDRAGLSAQLNTMKDDIKGFQQRIKDDTAIKFSMEAGSLKAQLDDLRRQLAVAKKSGDFDLQVKINADIARTSNELAQAQRELRNYARTGSQDISVLGKNFQSVNNEIERQGTLAQRALGGIREIANNAVITAIGAGIMKLGDNVVDLAGNLEQAKISFSTMLWSAEEAEIMLNNLSAFAAKTPFELVGIRQNAKQLLAMGIASQDIIPTLKALGDVSAGLSVPLERLTLAYGQVIAKGRLQGGELKQFTEAGVPLIKVLSEELGVSEAKFYKMVEAGQISSDQVVQAFQKMSWEGGQFANLMDAQSKTFKGTVSNIKDSMGQLGEQVGNIFLPILSRVALAIWSAVNRLRGMTVEFPMLTRVIAIAVAGIWILLTVLWWLWFILPAVTAATTALGISVGALLGPVWLVIWAIAVLGVGLDVYNKKQEESRLKNIAGAKSTGELNKEINNAQKELNALTESYRKGKIKQDEYDKKSKELRDRMGDLSKATEYTTFTQEELAHAMGVINKFEIRTDGDRAQLEALARQAKITAQALLEAARAKLQAFATTSKVAQAEIERQQTAKWERALAWGGAVAWIPVLSQVSLKTLAEDGAKVDAMNKEINKYDSMIKDIEKAQNKLNDLGKSWGLGGSAGKAIAWSGWGWGTKKVAEDVKKAIEAVKDATWKYEKGLDDLKKKTENLINVQQDYKDALIKNNNEMINKMREAQVEYDKTIKKIVQTRDEELKSIESKKNQDKNNNVFDFARSQADAYASSLERVKELRDRLSKADSDSQASIQQDITKELLAQEQIQKNLAELKKTWSENDAKSIETIVQEATYRASLTDQERAIYDFKKKQADVDAKALEDVAKTKQKAIDDQVTALQQLENTRASIETQKKIIMELEKVKFITKEQVDKYLSSEVFTSFDSDTQKLFEELLGLKLKISEAWTAKNKASVDAKTQELDLETKLGELQKKNLKQVKDDYDEIVGKINTLKKDGASTLQNANNAVAPDKSKLQEKATNTALGWITPIDPAKVVADDKTVADAKIATETSVRTLQAQFAEEKKVEDADKYLNEKTLHQQTIEAVQSLTQSHISSMQGFWQSYYSWLVTSTRSAVASMVSEYSVLASSLRQVIALQQQANSWGGKWFATWWYTGPGGKYDVAGVVHKGEYVVPQWMVNKYGGAVQQLEQIRSRGFAEGGYTSTTNRAVNVGNVTVSGDFDFDRAMEKWRWKI